MRSLSRRRRRPVRSAVGIIHAESLEERTMLDASGAVAEAAGFDYFDSREQFSEHLIQQTLSRWENSFDQPAWGAYWEYDATGAVLRNVVPLSFVGSSDTNTQVDGVDEADIIENDGQHLYLIQRGKIVIIDAAEPDEMSVVSSMEVEGSPVAMFLHDGTLTVVSRGWNEAESGQPGIGRGELLMVADWFRPGEPQTIVTSFDVTDTSDPSRIQQTTIDGNFLDARAIDGRIHVFTSSGVNLPAPRTVPIDPSDISDVSEYSYRHPTEKYESRETYEAWLREQINDLLDDALPEHKTSGASGVEVAGLVSDFDEIATLEGVETTNLVSIVTLDPTSDRLGLAGSTSVFSDSHGSRYATAEHLYLATTQYTEFGEESRILQFKWATDETNIELVASGTVSGQLLSQFAMDEHDGYLRVATTTRFWGDSDVRSSNNVFVLQNVDGRLTKVGAIEGFEENESIFAVRFDGDRAFIVTFERIDPLFMIDLSDPTSPTITGELEVPGFSTYLQRIDDDHLLAIGVIDGTTKVSVYDISDATAPSLVDEDVMPRWSHSAARYDHHAFGWYSQHLTLAIPVTNSLWRGEARSELITFKVDTSLEGEEVIKRRGSVSSESAYVQRSAFFGDVLYTVTTDSVIATDLAGKDELGRVDAPETVDVKLPKKTRPEFVLPENGTSPWAEIRNSTRRVLANALFVQTMQGNELQVLIPHQEDGVSVTLTGNTLTVSSEAGDETIEVAGNADLVIKGTTSDDSLSIDLSGAGEGVLRTLHVKANAGDDAIDISGMAEGLAYAKVTGSEGSDTITVDSAVTTKLMLFGGKGDDTITGGSGNDLVSGGPGNDMIYGGDGNDRLVGRSGADAMWGQNGNDSMAGGLDADRMYGGRGVDRMRGGFGNDRIHGSNGADELAGNEGDDVVVGGFGDDTFIDALTTTLGDRLRGGEGRDRYIAGTMPHHEVIDRLFDFRANEDIITELWNR